jgi:hypothetical protein
LNAFSHHEAENHRNESGLRPKVIPEGQMMQALHEGLQKWRNKQNSGHQSD